jgi:hypothetical protein
MRHIAGLRTLGGNHEPRPILADPLCAGRRSLHDIDGKVFVMGGDMTPHPAKTKAQRRILDEIGCGNYSVAISPRTREAMLAKGLIEPCGKRVIYQDRFGTVTVPEFQMPIAVHMQWCSHWAEQDYEVPA